jgi:hypothetical protein
VFDPSTRKLALQGVFQDDFDAFLTFSDKSLLGLLPAHKDKRGNRPNITIRELLCGMCYNAMHRVGKLSCNLKRATGLHMSDSGLFQHRQNISAEVLECISNHSLKVLSNADTQPHGYYADRLLVAIDGTTFNLRNSEEITKNFPKGKARRSPDSPLSEVAFARMYVSSLVEVGLHNPLALQVGFSQESEFELSMQLLAKLPEKFMLLCDRGYSSGYFAYEAQRQCECLNGAFLIRASNCTKQFAVKQVLEDGSRILEIRVRSQTNKNSFIGTVTVREIRASITKRNGELVEAKFWTNLLNPISDPALELVQLYASHWEHELYYGELKNELMDGDLLRSKTLLSAVQEIYMAVWATALIARVRSGINQTIQDDGLQISFQKVNDKINTIWGFAALVGTRIDRNMLEAAIQAAVEELKEETIPKRRNRSCPRTIRQNRIHWPKTIRYKSDYGPIKCQIKRYSELT